MINRVKPSCQANFRFIAELNEFLRPTCRQQWLAYRFTHSPGIKDPIEAMGIPHTDVEHIVVDGQGVTFSYRLRHGDRVTVYPASVKTDIATPISLRPELHDIRFVLDVHLGKLARLLRLLGFDVLYSNAYEDPELVNIAEGEQRILLTRDRRLLFHRRVVYGHFVHHCHAEQQAREIISHFQLRHRIHPFSRCTHCNGQLTTVDKHSILAQLEPKTRRYYQQFYRCQSCGQIYWKGSHFDGIADKFRALGLSLR